MSNFHGKCSRISVCLRAGLACRCCVDVTVVEGDGGGFGPTVEGLSLVCILRWYRYMLVVLTVSVSFADAFVSFRC